MNGADIGVTGLFFEGFEILKGTLHKLDCKALVCCAVIKIAERTVTGDVCVVIKGCFVFIRIDHNAVFLDHCGETVGEDISAVGGIERIGERNNIRLVFLDYSEVVLKVFKGVHCHCVDFVFVEKLFVKHDIFVFADRGIHGNAECLRLAGGICHLCGAEEGGIYFVLDELCFAGEFFVKLGKLSATYEVDILIEAADEENIKSGFFEGIFFAVLQHFNESVGGQNILGCIACFIGGGIGSGIGVVFLLVFFCFLTLAILLFFICLDLGELFFDEGIILVFGDHYELDADAELVCRDTVESKLDLLYCIFGR